MKRKINLHKWELHISSLAIGFLLALCLVFAVGASVRNDNGKGRYESCAAGNDDLAVFVIDTQTGQTWRLGRGSFIDYGTPQSPKFFLKNITSTIE